jgi:hypothetical protein
VADIIFIFDPALDRPIPVPEAAPPAVGEAIARAVIDAFDAAVATAKAARSAALVICGRVLDPERASPAQAAHLRQAVLDLAAGGCRTVVVADETAACHDLARMLGEPKSLSFVTPLAPFAIDVHGITVELVSAHGPAGTTVATTNAEAAVLQRRIIVGWDTTLWNADRWARARPTADDHGDRPADAQPPRSARTFAQAALASPAWSHPGTLWIWGSRHPHSLPVGVHHLPPLQARSAHESAAGSCRGLALVEPAARTGLAVPKADWRSSWHEMATHRVIWRTISVESVAGGDEELATAIWAALEAAAIGRPPAAGAPSAVNPGAVTPGALPIEIVRCSIECGTSVARRVRVAEISAETLARVRDLYDPKSFRVWCREVFAAPGESLAPLGHARSGGRPGSTTSFSSALADIVTAIEQSPAPPIPADLAREAGWLALELVEST